MDSILISIISSTLQSCRYTNSPLSSLPLLTFPPNPLLYCHYAVCVNLTHTQGYLFFHRVEPLCQVKASIGRIKRVAGVRSQGPTLPSKTLKWSDGLEFQTKCPLIHYTCNCTENLLPPHHLFSPHSLSSSPPVSPGFFFSLTPSLFTLSLLFWDKASHKVWIKLMTSWAVLWKSHCGGKKAIHHVAERVEKEEVKKRRGDGVRWALSHLFSTSFLSKRVTLSLFCFLASTQFVSFLPMPVVIHRRSQQVYAAHSLTGWPLVWERHRWQWKRAVVWTLAVKHLFKEWVLRTRASFARGGFSSGSFSGRHWQQFKKKKVEFP